MELRNYLPQRHQKTQIGKAQEAMWPLVQAEREAREDILAQLWVDTATWGLRSWEKALGLETPAESDGVRRSRIRAKLRGMGSVTPALLQQIAESYARGDIEVREIPREHRVEIAFVNQLGKPSGVESLKASLAEIIPAHLLLEYIWQYRTWGEARGYTWRQVTAYTWDQLRDAELG